MVARFTRLQADRNDFHDSFRAGKRRYDQISVPGMAYVKTAATRVFVLVPKWCSDLLCLVAYP